MPSYKLLIDVQNVHTYLDEKEHRGGFFVTRIVEDRNPESAFSNAIEALQSSTQFHQAVRNDASDPPRFVLDEWEVISRGSAEHFETGFIFY